VVSTRNSPRTYPRGWFCPGRPKQAWPRARGELDDDPQRHDQASGEVVARGLPRGCARRRGVSTELSVPAKRCTVVKRGAAQANGGSSLKGTVESTNQKFGLGSGRNGTG
jgi:hypothetical protein